MSPESLVLSPDVVAALCWSVACFVAGVAFACYRAVGWVERIRTWAHSDAAGVDS